MKANKKHIGQEDFRRYLENLMTDAERNAFERELQKNPFEAEALEGFNQISTADLNKDFKELSQRINSGKKKNKIRYWAAAATFLVLITSSIVWFQMKEKLELHEVAQTKSIQKEEIKIRQPEPRNEEIIVSAELKDSGTNLSITKESVSKKVEKKKVVPPPILVPSKKVNVDAELRKSLQLVAVNEQKAEERVMPESKVAVAPKSEIRIRGVSSINENRKAGSGSNDSQMMVGDTKIVSGKVISQEDSLPLPGVTIIEKGTSNGTISDLDGKFILKLTDTKDSVLVASFVGMEKKEFYSARDSSLVVALVPSSLAMDEVVVVGYGIQKKSNLTGSVAEVKADKTDNTDVDAQPTEGMEHFKEYINKHAILPVDYPEKKVIVKVGLKIDAQGNVVSVENVGQAESPIFNMARKLILEGPAWNPRTVNGTAVESETTWRVVFKKQK